MREAHFYDESQPKCIANMWREIPCKREKIGSIEQMELRTMDFTEFVERGKKKYEEFDSEDDEDFDDYDFEYSYKKIDIWKDMNFSWKATCADNDYQDAAMRKIE